MSTETTYQGLVVRGLATFSDRPALVDGDVRLSGRQLDARVAQMVQAYRDNGLRTGDRVALLGANCADYVVAQLAAVALGVTYTGLHPLASVPELASVLRTLAPEALVFVPDSSATVAKVRDHLGRHECRFLSLGPGEIGVDLCERRDEQDTTSSTSSLWVPVSADHVPSISFTGGTTGRSKGVLRSQRSLACSVTTMMAEWDWPAELRFLAAAPLSHATGSMVPAVLLRGGCVHIRAGFDPMAVVKQIRREKITSTFLVPTMLYRLIDLPSSVDADLASLRHVMYGAAPMSPGRLAEAIRRWGTIFNQLYGQVEAPNTIATLHVADHRLDVPGRLASCGRPTLANEVRLMDENGYPVPSGMPGEICVRGPLVMDGYLDDPDATRDAFRDGWLRTGDMATSDADGFLTIVDRRKDVIVSGGFNIFAGDVERSLAMHPAVSEAAVIGTPDDLWGEAVTAYVVLREPALDPRELVAHVRADRGSAWAPKHIHIVDALPLTPLGKPDKPALRRRHWPVDGRAVN
ncbi:AMP-binding protein [Microtetraspora sp. NBRC 16547]|uniref:AMP-binding protein n=1 Tax=Microtetraspora sp. NBRC 16547 TaxID=3030993 RepID=UPI0024A1468F|nr:AMP-binding protein [Microtetraspora sp. NBRC 16547]GLW99339.1 acyl-CoA synthetase [Microtetraspora sp. NBRC 16547]